ncbi:MAG: ankyrin repeat domain-containing protein [Polaromonas sp.]|nr:ankyrin repeat domain-containing protein [Polaromonas sp.]
MNRPDQNDELIRRYREASAQDERRPSAQVREAVRAHAAMISASKLASPAVSAPAANQSRWKISLLASIALAGLTGLLVLQFDRGTPDEQETALGRPAPAVIPPQPASPPPAVADAKAARSEAPAARPAAPAPLPKAAVRPARPAPDVGVAAPAAASPPRPADPEPPAAQHAPARERAAEAARDQASEKALAPAAPQAMARSAAAPALRMPAPAPAQESLSAQAPRSAAALAAALHQAARAGQLPDVEALLQQGAAINAPDGAGRTALMLAVIQGHSELVRRLLALGANPALVDREGLDALAHARRLGRDDIARLIEARS